MTVRPAKPPGCRASALHEPGRRRRPLAYLGLALLFAAFAARAQDEPLLSEHAFLSEIPRVDSITRLPQSPADTPGAVTIIDREMIRASGARDIPELFRLVPGFIVGYPRGAQPVVAYHGLSGQISQRMQVLLDGRSLYAPYLFGGIDWNTLPINLDDIERIEVLRGSNSATYGANAFLGVANIVTRSAAQSAGAYASVNVGSSSIFDSSLRLGGGSGDLHWRLSAGSRHDDGLKDLFDSRTSTYLSLRAELRASPEDELMLEAGVNDNRIGVGFPNNAGDPERYESTYSYFGLLRWRRYLGPDHELSLSYSHTSDRGTDNYTIPATATQGLRIDYGRDAVRDQFEYQHFIRLSPSLRASWGAEYRSDSVTAPQLFNTTEAQRTGATRAYLNGEWRPSEHWTFNAGGLVENETISGWHFAPRLMANWKFAPDQTVRIGYSEAFRTPSLFEQRSDWRFVFEGETIDVKYLSKGGLRPETVHATELSYLGNWRALGLTLDARLFRERVDDLITQQRYELPPGGEFDPDSGVFDLRNNQSATITGLEYQLRYKPTPDQLWLLGQYVARGEGSAPFIAESIPERTLHFLGSLRLPGERRLSMGYYHSNPVRWIGEAASVSTRQLNLKLEQTFRLGSSRASLALVGQNLQGDRTEFRPGQLMPRRGWITLAVDY